MSLRILSSPDPAPTLDALREAIAQAIPGHFTIVVASEAFAGRSLVQQQQLVYGAIAPLMAGDAAPVHAIDRLVTRVR